MNKKHTVFLNGKIQHKGTFSSPLINMFKMTSKRQESLGVGSNTVNTNFTGKSKQELPYNAEKEK